MSLDSNIDRLFVPKLFNDSPVNNVFLTKEAQIYLHARTPQNQAKYATFDELFRTWLLKLPNNNIKKYVTTIFNKGMVYIGDSAGGRNEIVFARVFTDTHNKISGIALDASSLDIDINTGETSNIDDCVYATYFGMIRAAILNEVAKIKSNKDLHKLIITYIYNIIMRAVGKRNIFSDKQRGLIFLACAYIFYRHFLSYKHSMAMSVLKKEYSQYFEKNIDEFLPLFDTISKFDTMKDISKILIDLNVFHESPGAMLLSLIKFLGNTGFYAFIGPLDQLIGMIILCKYPTNLFPKEASVPIDKIHEGIEDIITTYIDDLQYSPTKLFG